MEGKLEIRLEGERVCVRSEFVRQDPQLNVPIGVKVSKGFIPEYRTGINDWFKKHF